MASKMSQDATSSLQTLEDLQSRQPLSILHLAEPILSNTSTSANSDPKHRQSFKRDLDEVQDESHESNTGPEQLTPQSLQADLSHYKDLFSKLRFSYLEQTTKEKYLRGIVGDPPVIATPADNLALEEKLAGMKSELQAKKAEVDRLVHEIEQLAHDLALKFDKIQNDKQILSSLPSEIQEMQAEVKALKEQLANHPGNIIVSEDPRMNMSLAATQSALEEQKRRNRELDEQIAALQKQLPAKTRDCERADRDLQELESRRNESARTARDLQKRKEEGGRDPLEEQGRWYRGVDGIMRSLLGVEG